MLLVTDLDNTLYDWVTSFAKSFRAMLDELTTIVDETEAEIIDQFKCIHQRYGNSEQPFAVFELPAVRKKFPSASRRDLLELLDIPLHAFNSARKEHLRLYDGVEETLRELSRCGVVVVGHSEAIAVNAYYRLDRLGIKKYFQRLYTLEGRFDGHPDPERQRELQMPSGFLKELPKSERKPNPIVLEDICKCEGVSVEECWYVGDSLVRDISMACAANAKAVWARYGTEYDSALWDLLVSITHWTEDDVAREARLRAERKNVKPDFTIDSYRDLLSLIPFTRQPPRKRANVNSS